MKRYYWNKIGKKVHLKIKSGLKKKWKNVLYTEKLAQFNKKTRT